MSAYSAYVSEDKIIIATDTLLMRDNQPEQPGQPSVKEHIGFTHKVHFFPNYRCCMVVFGYHQTGLYLDRFVNNTYGCTDIEYLVNLIERRFFDYIDIKSYPSVHGTPDIVPGLISVFAYSKIEAKMVWYVIKVARDGIKVTQKTTPGAVFSVPPIKDKQAENAVCNNVDLGLYGLLTELIKLQYAESKNDVAQTMPIGGEVMMTTMLSSPSFSISMEFVHTFDNYNQANEGFIKNAFNLNKKPFMHVL